MAVWPVMAKFLRLSLGPFLAVALVAFVRQDHRNDAERARALAAELLAVDPDHPPEPRQVLETLESAGPSGLPVAIELLRAPAANVRLGAVVYLGYRRSRLAVPGLIRLLRDRAPLVRRAAATALGVIADPQAMWFLRRAMASEDVELAEAALKAARRIHARSSPPPGT